MARCEVCWGRGTRRCGRCEGTGLIERPSGWLGYELRSCPACRGSGEVVYRPCGGSGERTR